MRQEKNILIKFLEASGALNQFFHSSAPSEY